MKGYIAIVSTIIISILLLGVTLAVNSASFFGRANILKSEFKERSAALADACVNTALLKLAQAISYGGGETVLMGSDTCSILTIESSPGQKIIKTKGNFQLSVTNLKVIVKDTDLSLISWEEVGNF